MLLTSSTEERHTHSLTHTTEQEHFHIVRTAFSQRYISFVSSLSLSIFLSIQTHSQSIVRVYSAQLWSSSCHVLGLKLRLKLKESQEFFVLCARTEAETKHDETLRIVLWRRLKLKQICTPTASKHVFSDFKQIIF